MRTRLERGPRGRSVASRARGRRGITRAATERASASPTGGERGREPERVDRSGVVRAHDETFSARVQLGVRLFHRAAQRLSLTEAGARLLTRTRAIVEHVEDLLDDARGVSTAVHGRLRVSAPLDLSCDTSLWLDLFAQYPEVSLEIELTNRYVDVLREGYDIAMRAGRGDDESLTLRRLGAYQLYAVASPEYVGRHGRLREPREPRRRPGSSWQRSRDGVLLIIDVPVTGADPCQRGCRVGSPIPLPSDLHGATRRPPRRRAPRRPRPRRADSPAWWAQADAPSLFALTSRPQRGSSARARSAGRNNPSLRRPDHGENAA